MDVAKELLWTIRQEKGVLSVHVPDSLFAVTQPLATRLSLAEQAQIRAAFEPDDHARDLTDRFESGSLLRFIARRQSGWLLDMIGQNRLVSVFQPIVTAATVQLFGYECLVRGIERGALVAAGRIMQVAGGAGLLFEADYGARCAAIREAARYDISGKIFINFSPSAFEDEPVQGLLHTVSLLDDLEIPRRRVVFEIIETERIANVDQLERTLDHYRGLDFEVALDDVGAGYASLNLLQRLRPDYVKLDAQLVRGVDDDSYKAVLTAKLLEASVQLGVKTIAEGVETRGEHEWLRRHGADYLQGFYFARPASPPPALPAN